MGFRKNGSNLSGYFNEVDLSWWEEEGDTTRGKQLYFLFLFFVFSRATPTAYGDSQARGLIEVLDAGLHQSHSNAGSELMATSDP